MCSLLAFICVVIAAQANDKPAAEVAILLLIAAAIGLFASFCWFNVLIRRRPLLRICNEAIEVNVIGRGSLDNLPIPILIKLAWLMLSMRAFKKQIGWVPWESFQGVVVGGLPTMRTLTIHGTVAYPKFHGDEIEATVSDHIMFCASEFREPLETIEDTIKEFFKHPASRDTLPSLHKSNDAVNRR